MAMPKNGEVSKSQLMREYLDANPKATIKDVIAGLAEKNVLVSASLVHGIFRQMGKPINRPNKMRSAKTAREPKVEQNQAAASPARELASGNKAEPKTKRRAPRAPKTSRVRNTAGGRKTARGPKTIRGSNGHGNLSLDTLFAAKKLADALGGVQNAKAALDVLAKLG